MALLTSGCAFTRTETAVHYSPVVNHPLAAQARKGTLAIGEFTDSRLVSDPYVLVQKANQYGATSGAFVTRDPVAEILKNGLADALRKNGFIGDQDGKYELRGDLQSFDGGVIQGFWSPNTAKAKITVRFELVEKHSGRPVWHDTLSGQTSKQFSTGYIGADFLAALFADSADQLADRLLSDEEFRAFFE